MPMEDADLVIRVGVLPDSDLIARHLMTTEVWTCASSAYLAQYGTPSRVADLRQHTLIAGFDRQTTWSFRKADSTIEQFAFKPDHVVSDSAALAPMLVGNAGIGRLPDFTARPLVTNGDLVRLFTETHGDTFEINAVYISHRSLSAKVRVFIDALVEHLAHVEP